MKDTVVVLAMHGTPAVDFPRNELGELFGLHMRLEQGGMEGPQRDAIARRHGELDRKIREWPRTAENDPFFAASQDLAKRLSSILETRVVAGFNEFCAPSVEQVLEDAAEEGANRIVVVTPMMTTGGGHSERDIPEVIERVRSKHPRTEIVYAWPFEPNKVAEFLAKHIKESTGPA